MKNKIVKNIITILFVSILLIQIVPIVQNQFILVNANPDIGFFEGEVPIHGAYLKAINCVPGYGPDKDENGVYDKGYTQNFDGIKDTKYVEEPLIVDLAANGFFPGDKIMISYKNNIRHDDFFYYKHLYGLFSTSNELLTEEYTYDSGDGPKWPMVGPLDRVPGAIDAALGGYIHKPSDFSYGQGPFISEGVSTVPNDIPEDFRISHQIHSVNGVLGDPWSPEIYFFSIGFWITIPPEAKYLFFQLQDAWMIYQRGWCTVTIDKDTDGDAIPDSWEKNGIDFNKDGLLDLVLEGADYMKKDLYVEVDYMGSSGTCSGHNPFPSGSLFEVQYAFENAPAGSVKNPDGSEGITLHIDGSEADEIPHQDIVKAFDDVGSLRNSYFGTEIERNDSNEKWILWAKKWVYRYSLFVHQFSLKNSTTGTWDVKTSSGIAESANGCNDFLVSLGGFSTNPGTIDEQAATFMHELGHALGLGHGGGDSINYKPNYLSIMNYLFQFDSRVHTRPLDFSRIKLDTLDEDELDELNGLGVNQVNTYDKPWYQTAYSAFSGHGTTKLKVTLLMPIDWNNDTNIEPDQLENLNDFPQWNYASPLHEKLNGWNDWVNLQFYFQNLDSFAGGFEPQDYGQEMTWELKQQISEAWDQFEPLSPPDSDFIPLPTGNGETETPLVDTILFIVLGVVALAVVIGFFVIKRKKS